MTTYTWIKLYIELLDDPKVGMMPDWMFRRFIQFLLYAREYNQDGLLGPVSDLAWRLRSSEDDMLKALRPMSEIGIVAETPDGWLVVNFEKRQAPISSAERIKEFRKRQSNDDVTKSYKECNEHVTDDVTKSYKECNEHVTNGNIDSISISISSSDSISDSIFNAHFRCFNSEREKQRWSMLFEAIGKDRAEEIATWAEKKEIHMVNRGGLMDSLETAAKKWIVPSTKLNKAELRLERLKTA